MSEKDKLPGHVCAMVGKMFDFHFEEFSSGEAPKILHNASYSGKPWSVGG